MASYLEHMALKVSDIEWHVKFFEEVFDMPVRMTLGEAPNRKIWLHAGIQLNEETDFENKSRPSWNHDRQCRCGIRKSICPWSKRTSTGA